MNYPITIDKLAAMLLKESAKGNGHKFILMSSDDEGNEYHALWNGVSDGEEVEKYIDPYQVRLDIDLKDCVILA